jgi:F-type H+-transporting ATPase subunit epsilon
MFLNIIAQNKIIYQGKVSSVTLPGEKGELTILPNHIPLITSLTEGKIKVQDKNQKELFFEIESGVLEVNPVDVNVLVSV